jgi:hypothetical protein
MHALSLTHSQASQLYLCCDTELDATEWINALSSLVGTCALNFRTNTSAAKPSRLLGVDIAVMEAKKYGSKVSSPYCVVGLNNVKVSRAHCRTCWAWCIAYGASFMVHRLGFQLHDIPLNES